MGIIANTLNNGQTAYGADTEKVDPSLQTVDQPTQTVAGQLHSILANDSPYIQQARSGALDTANGRGLINSSIAAGAGESAAIGAALPIASQDASTYTHVADTNQAAKNAAATFNAGATNTANLNTAAAGNTSQLSTQQTAQQKELIATQGEQARQTQAQGIEGQKEITTLSGEIQTQLQTLKGSQAADLSNIEGSYKQLIQTSQAASSFYGTAMAMLAAVMANTDTTPEQKQAAVDRINGMLSGGLNVIGSLGNVDLTTLLNFG